MKDLISIIKGDVDYLELVGKINLELGIKKTPKKSSYKKRNGKNMVRWCVAINPRILDTIKRHHGHSGRRVTAEWVISQTLKLGSEVVGDLLKKHTAEIMYQEEKRLADNDVVPDHNDLTGSVNFYVDTDTSGRFKIMSVINDTPYQDVMRIMIFHYYSMIK